MRLLTHNSLKCPAKEVAVGYPLGLEIEDMEIVETECNAPFLRSLLPTLDWKAVCIAADAVGLKDIPALFDVKLLEDEDFILAMHNLLLDVHVIKGCLICPESKRKFEIANGIPDMMYDVNSALF